MSSKVTLVLGASTNPERYSYKAAQMLNERGHKIKLVGLRGDTLFGNTIETASKPYKGIDTITVYVGEKNQQAWYPVLLESGVRRIILNPGAESAVLTKLAEARGIEVVEACTLVLLATGQY